jgi:drug/metabolite transporter (DMT)-like permease
LPLLAASALASTLPLLGFAFALGERIMPTNWTPLVAMALCSQVIGQGLMVYAVGRISPLMIGLMLLTQPVTAGLVGWIGYNEILGPFDLLGAGLIGIALILARETASPKLPGAAEPLEHHGKQHRDR